MISNIPDSPQRAGILESMVAGKRAEFNEDQDLSAVATSVRDYFSELQKDTISHFGLGGQGRKGYSQAELLELSKRKYTELSKVPDETVQKIIQKLIEGKTHREILFTPGMPGMDCDSPLISQIAKGHKDRISREKATLEAKQKTAPTATETVDGKSVVKKTAQEISKGGKGK